MRKVLSWLLIAAMAFSLCTFASAETPAADKIDFADGTFGFLGLSTAKGNADAAAELSVVDYQGGKALKIASTGKAPYVAFNIEGLLGDKLSEVRAISATFGIDEAGPDGKFYAASGVVYTYTGEENVEAKHDWSVYLAKKNPRTIVTKLAETEVFVPGMNNSLVISKETDNCQSATGTPLAMYLTDLQFLDAEGNALPVDLTAVYVSADTGRDTSNLFALSNPVVFEGFETTGGGWGQNGFDWDPAVLEALVPGSVMEIEYESEDGSMWVVFPDAAAGWSRIAQDQAYINGSKNIAQITYDQIVAVVGEDKTAWGGRLQCEAKSNWTVFSVKVGTCGHQLTLANAVEFPGFETTGGGWGQNGFDWDPAVLEALVPGSAIEVTFESEDNSMWVVFPDAAAGWSRIGQDTAAIQGGKAYITYDQIKEVVGEDPTAWGGRLQCEAKSNWTVYSVRVGQLVEIPAVRQLVEFPGFETTGGGWGQNGFDWDPAVLEALVPGSVLVVTFESEDNSMWVVFPDAAAGWSRIAQDTAVIQGGKAYITYDQIKEVVGEDQAAWGGRLQCEAKSNWTVYGVAVGQAQ